MSSTLTATSSTDGSLSPASSPEKEEGDADCWYLYRSNATKRARKIESTDDFDKPYENSTCPNQPYLPTGQSHIAIQSSPYLPSSSTPHPRPLWALWWCAALVMRWAADRTPPVLLLLQACRRQSSCGIRLAFDYLFHSNGSISRGSTYAKIQVIYVGKLHRLFIATNTSTTTLSYSSLPLLLILPHALPLPTCVAYHHPPLVYVRLVILANHFIRCMQRERDEAGARSEHPIDLINHPRGVHLTIL